MCKVSIPVTSVFAFALAAIVAAPVRADLPAGGSCREAQAWISEHSGSLPSTAAEMAQLPPAHRRYSFAALEPEVKSRIWRERLEGVLKERQLTDAQRAVVQEAIAVFSPELYRGGSVSQSWRSAVARTFSRSDAIEVFEQLGPAGLLPLCGCNNEDDCPPNRDCNFESCTPTASGCGPGGADQCGDGVCRLP